jgi:uncharacterized damage-inducible protein DinB
MSKAVVSTMQAGFARTMGMIREFISVCPDTLWGKKFAGWPVWQQLYHGLSAVELFALEEGQTGTAALAPADVGSLKTQGAAALGKQQMLEFATAMEEAANRFCASLDDAKLGEPQKALSAKFGAPMNNAAALGLLNSHTMYHLGCCDAALREHGLKGVF